MPRDLERQHRADSELGHPRAFIALSQSSPLTTLTSLTEMEWSGWSARSGRPEPVILEQNASGEIRAESSMPADHPDHPDHNGMVRVVGPVRVVI